jgi:hypothetical protein
MGRLGDVDVNGDRPAKVENAHDEQKEQTGKQGELNHRLASPLTSLHQ